MRKKELTAMPILKVTPYMKRLAMEDVPKIEKLYGRTYKEYKHWGHTRCCTKNGILKLAIFFTEPMRMGASLPAYEMYFDKKKREYITYDREREKWLTATFYNLNRPTYAYYSHGNLRLDRETRKAITKYFDNGSEGMNAIVSFQNQILADKLKAKHKRETDPWDEDLKQTPDLPKDWDAWVSKVGIPNIISFIPIPKRKDRPAIALIAVKMYLSRNLGITRKVSVLNAVQESLIKQLENVDVWKHVISMHI